MRHLVKWTTVVAVFALIGAALAALANQQADLRERNEVLAVQLLEQRQASTVLADQLRAVGEEPLVDPGDPIPGPQGETGAPGAQGVPGPVGPPPSLTTVLAAIKEYCANGRCRGRDGTNGRDGRPGAPGDRGEPGESVTGPPGPPGEDGQDGQDGRDGRDGATGEPGPTCPDGYTARQRTVRTDQHPDGEQTIVCVADPAP